MRVPALLARSLHLRIYSMDNEARDVLILGATSPGGIQKATHLPWGRCE